MTVAFQKDFELDVNRHYQHWTQDEMALLGTAPDEMIARKLSRTATAVKDRRHRLRIPAYTNGALYPSGNIAWTKEMIAMLGSKPDAELAREWEVRVEPITRRRQSFKILSWPRQDNAILVNHGYRICTKCREKKMLGQFYKDAHFSEGYTTWCKVCTTKYQVERARENKIFLVAAMGECCQRCGYNETMAGLSFHHIDGRDDLFFSKGGSIAKLGYRKRMEEADKCALLCRCCHQGFHAGEIDIAFEKRNGLGWTITGGVK